MTPRQLRLPGIDRPKDDWRRAHRDLSARAFARALDRNGFRTKNGVGIEFVDTTGRPYLGVYRTDPIRIRRRATPAKLLKERGT